jgi:hypothetical protein
MSDEIEQWKTVLGHAGRYEVSDLGRVRSLRFRGNGYDVLRSSPKYLKPIKHSNGYLYVSLGILQVRQVHSLVLNAFVGPRPGGMGCRHLDGQRENNRLPNLCWGTRIENEDDKLAHGTRARGERQGNAKLTAEHVQYILLAPRTGRQKAVLSKKFGVSRSSIHNVMTGRTWAHVLPASEVA